MERAMTVTWDDKKGRGRAVVVTMALLSALVLTPAGQAARAATGDLVSVIVREMPRADRAPEDLVEGLGGTVIHHISIIDGFTASVPRESIPTIAAAAEVRSVTQDARIQLSGHKHGNDDDDDEGTPVDPTSMYGVAQEIGAPEFWDDGYTGEGVGVALIDSGVVPVDGLAVAGKVINGPDLSFEGQVPEVEHLDTFGHGTHMAGIIAGRDDTVPLPVTAGDPAHFMGIAPGAHIINLKVADALGSADVSQVIAAIDWVVTHRDDPGLNIRVLNLSFGTDGVQSYQLDPLAYAVEAAWHSGIVVAVAAGNQGFGSMHLNNPALDPYVIAVGAAVTDGIYGVRKNTESIAPFSSNGDATRPPDILAPGKSIASLRNPGSFIDTLNPQARVGDRFFRGSGTSQASAVISGAAALIIQQRPSITPDQVKYLLTSTANDIKGAAVTMQGRGLLDLKKAEENRTPDLKKATQRWPLATGLGSLDLARGSAHVSDGDAVLAGEVDIFGEPWNPQGWTAMAAAGTAWVDGEWLGKTWSGSCWCGVSWAGLTWSSDAWSGKTWSGKTWSEFAWAGKTWSTGVWTGDIWSGKTWSGKTWSGDVWSGSLWG